jgi:hypothetical protein
MDKMTREEQIEKLTQAAEIMGISVEQLFATQLTALDRVEEEGAKIEDSLPPPPIVYPNLKFKPYRFREYDKIVYRGRITDIEQPVTKYVQRADGSGTDTIQAIRVIPDQFVEETRIVKSRGEEMALIKENTRLPLGKRWMFTRDEAIEEAKKAKGSERPIVERDLTAAERKAARKAAEQQAEEEAALRKEQHRSGKGGRKAA